MGKRRQKTGTNSKPPSTGTTLIDFSRSFFSVRSIELESFGGDGRGIHMKLHLDFLDTRGEILGKRARAAKGKLKAGGEFSW